MICIIALVVFAVLGIFSVSYRPLAKEAFDCVFRKVTFRKCKTDLDKRLKSQLTGKLMTKSPKLASFTYKHFVVLSWVLTLLFILSTIYTGIGIYNYAKYGDCNGPHSDQFCIFNPTGSEELSCGSKHCEEFGCACGEAESLCTPENNFSACNGNCDCNQNVCGASLNK